MKPLGRAPFALFLARAAQDRLLVGWILALAGVYQLAILLAQVGPAVTSSWNTTHPEGAIVYSIAGLSDGTRPLYRDLSSPPFVPTLYAPLFYLASAALAYVLGGGIEAATLAGRLVAVLAGVAAVAFSYQAATLAARRRSSAAGATLLAAGTSILVPWSVTCRPDSLATALSIAAVTRFAFRPPGGTRIAVPAALCALALLSKQSYLPAPLAIGCWLLMERRYRDALVFGASLAGMVGGAVVFAHVVTGGRFLENVVVGNLAPLRWDSLPWFFLRGYLAPGALLLATAAAGFLAAPSRSPGRRPGLWPLYAVLSLALFAAFTMKSGSGRSYYLEPLLALTPLSARGFDWLLSRPPLGHLPARALQTAALLLCVVAAWPKPRYENKSYPHHIPPGDILFRYRSQRVLYLDPTLATLSTSPVELLDSYALSYLEQAGRVDLSPLVDKISSRAFERIVAYAPHWRTYHGVWYLPEAIGQAIGREYEIDEWIGQLPVYAPKKAVEPATFPRPSFLPANEGVHLSADDFTGPARDGRSLAFHAPGTTYSARLPPLKPGVMIVELLAMESQAPGRHARLRLRIGGDVDEEIRLESRAWEPVRIMIYVPAASAAEGTLSLSLVDFSAPDSWTPSAFVRSVRLTPVP